MLSGLWAVMHLNETGETRDLAQLEGRLMQDRMRVARRCQHKGEVQLQKMQCDSVCLGDRCSIQAAWLRAEERIYSSIRCSLADGK